MASASPPPSAGNTSLSSKDNVEADVTRVKKTLEATSKQTSSTAPPQSAMTYHSAPEDDSGDDSSEEEEEEEDDDDSDSDSDSEGDDGDNGDEEVRMAIRQHVTREVLDRDRIELTLQTWEHNNLGVLTPIGLYRNDPNGTCVLRVRDHDCIGMSDQNVDRFIKSKIVLVLRDDETNAIHVVDDWSLRRAIEQARRCDDIEDAFVHATTSGGLDEDVGELLIISAAKGKFYEHGMYRLRSEGDKDEDDDEGGTQQPGRRQTEQAPQDEQASAKDVNVVVDGGDDDDDDDSKRLSEEGANNPAIVAAIKERGRRTGLVAVSKMDVAVLKEVLYEHWSAPFDVWTAEAVDLVALGVYSTTGPCERLMDATREEDPDMGDDLLSAVVDAGSACVVFKDLRDDSVAKYRVVDSASLVESLAVCGRCRPIRDSLATAHQILQPLLDTDGKRTTDWILVGVEGATLMRTAVLGVFSPVTACRGDRQMRLDADVTKKQGQKKGKRKAEVADAGSSSESGKKPLHKKRQ